MIQLDFKKPIAKTGAVKATTHKDGKIGFSSGAAKYMDLDNNRIYMIGTNSQDTSDECFYFVRTERDTEDTFKIGKAGSYFYLRMAHLLEEQGINYEENKIIYDISQMKSDSDMEETVIFKLKPRVPISRK